MVDELSHRVKNTLSIVQDIAHQTFRGDDVAFARAAFDGRLGALAAHNLLTRANWEMAELEESGYGASGAGAASVSPGPRSPTPSRR